MVRPARAAIRVPITTMAPSTRSWVRTSVLSAFMDRPVMTMSPVVASLEASTL